MRTKTLVQAEKILLAAERLFASHRFHEVRMDDIASAAGVGKGTLYRYFQDKQELYLALLDRAAQELPRRLSEADNPTLPPRQRLESLVAASLNYFDEQPYLFDLISHTEVIGAMDRGLSWNQTRQETTARFQQVLEAGIAAGVFHAPDPRLSVMLLLGGMRAVLRFGDLPRPAGLARQVTNCFLAGHLAGATSPGKLVEGPAA